MAFDTSARLANAVDISSSTQGAGVDISGVAAAIQGVCEFRMWVEDVTGTDPTLDITIQESDDDSTYRDVAKFRQLSATKTTTDQYVCAGLVSQRYLRWKSVIGGTNTPTYNNVTIYARGLGVTIPYVPAAT